MTAERKTIYDLDVMDRGANPMKAASSQGHDPSRRAEPAEGDIDDGETTLEDSGAGSFLDRFAPPQTPDRS